MTHTQISDRPSSFSLAEKSVPFDVLRLLDVLGRIEQRRQERVRALRQQQICFSPTPLPQPQVPSWADG